MDAAEFFNRLDAKLHDAINDRARPHDETRHIFAELRRMFREVLDDSGTNAGVRLDHRGRRVDLDANPEIERRRGRRVELAGGRVIYPDEPHEGQRVVPAVDSIVQREPPPAPLTGQTENPPAVINDPLPPAPVV